MSSNEQTPRPGAYILGCVIPSYLLRHTSHTSRPNTHRQHDKQLRLDSHTRLNGDVAF